MGNANRPDWQGINHLALVTDDMDGTVRFYHEVIGAPIVATVGTDDFRHYFFRIGSENTVAFFEYRDAELDRYEKPAGIPYPKASQFDHVSFNLSDEEALLDLRRRLKEHDCEVTDVVDHGFMRSIYFTDNNGIALEATYWVEDATDGDPDFSDDSVFRDPNPVPALSEIMQSGTVAHTPSTHLVDDVTERY